MAISLSTLKAMKKEKQICILISFNFVRSFTREGTANGKKQLQSLLQRPVSFFFIPQNGSFGVDVNNEVFLSLTFIRTLSLSFSLFIIFMATFLPVTHCTPSFTRPANQQKKQNVFKLIKLKHLFFISSLHSASKPY